MFKYVIRGTLNPEPKASSDKKPFITQHRVYQNPHLCTRRQPPWSFWTLIPPSQGLKGEDVEASGTRGLLV